MKSWVPSLLVFVAAAAVAEAGPIKEHPKPIAAWSWSTAQAGGAA